MSDDDDYEYDALIVGSGPVGATYARLLVEEGKTVLMVESGTQESAVAGEHKKNAVNFQKDIDAFVHIIHGSLHPSSVPTNKAAVPTLPPICWPATDQIYNGQNPHQDPTVNLDANGVSRNVGGMSTHWTCATPRQHKTVERSNIFNDEEWTDLYDTAEKLIGTSTTVLDNSIRQALVKQILRNEYKLRQPAPLPLAAKNNTKNEDFIIWASSSTILGPIKDKIDEDNIKLFTLWSQAHCEQLIISTDKAKVAKAKIFHLASNRHVYVRARKYIVCGGPILTPQLLYKSGFVPTKPKRPPPTDPAEPTDIPPPSDTPEHLKLPALGRYLTEQTMCFCQIVLNEKWIKAVADETYNPYEPDSPEGKEWAALKEWWWPRVKDHLESTKDKIPFPYNDLDPQVTLPLAEGYPWHTQIHRDAFSYGAVPPAIDKRTIVDLRFFGIVQPTFDNYVTFEDDITDAYGMPQPTFRYKLGAEDRQRTHDMMKDMERAACALGGYLPGSEPQFLAPGLALHVCGTTVAGKQSNSKTPKQTSCCDENSKIWDFDDLYVGGLNVIPGPNGSNPTLTAICFAVQGARHILESLKTVHN
ncbi:hypothetical protein BBP40_004238 [Aspergillus hancockii]|nr:hypothetical protein BBP40_004238 [Aspergillus hancockii]